MEPGVEAFRQTAAAPYRLSRALPRLFEWTEDLYECIFKQSQVIGVFSLALIVPLSLI